MDVLYRDEILEHYRAPHNQGRLTAPTHAASRDNPLCGDRVSLEVAVRDGRVAEAAFTGRGCAISQAAASMLTDALRDQPLSSVTALTGADAVGLLGVEVSAARLKCATLAFETLRTALTEGEVKPAD